MGSPDWLGADPEAAAVDWRLHLLDRVLSRDARTPVALPGGGRSVRIPANTLPAGEASMLLLTVTALQDGELLSVSSQATITPPLEPLAAAVAGGSQRSAAISERLVLDGSPSRDPSQKGDLSFSWVCVEASGASAEARAASARCARPRRARAPSTSARGALARA